VEKPLTGKGFAMIYDDAAAGMESFLKSFNEKDFNINNGIFCPHYVRVNL